MVTLLGVKKLKNKLFALAFLIGFLPASVFGWNALGHRLIAQIAYDHMTAHARQTFNDYNQALDKVYKPQSFINAAVWLDTLRYQDVSWFASMHYIDLPFSEDGSPLLPPQEINAVWAITKSTHLLLNKYATAYDKGIALRVLLHIVGDVHQPLHAATRVSVQLPQGDRGGNLVLLQSNHVAKNLHAYWDRGAGLLAQKKQDSPSQIEKRAESIEQRWPCEKVALDISSPMQWAEESHSIAIKAVYQLPINHRYQQQARKIAEKRVAIAGCRLAMLLNKIDETLVTKPSFQKRAWHPTH